MGLKALKNLKNDLFLQYTATAQNSTICYLLAIEGYKGNSVQLKLYGCWQK